MTDDQIWERASIGERVEMLKRRVDAASWPPKFARVSGFTPGSEGPPHEYVACSDIERWKRIEKAAKLVDSWDPIRCGVSDKDMLADLHKLTLALWS